MQSTLPVAVKAVKAGGAVLKRFFGKKLDVRIREDETMSSSANVLAEKKMLEAIHRRFPDHSILSTEAGVVENDAYHKWLIEPLDETLWLSRGVTAFGCSVAFERRSVLESAAVFFPMTNELFSAEKGKGARCNNKPLRVSKTPELERALVYFDDFRSFIRRNHVPQLELLIKRSERAVSSPGKLRGLMAIARGEADIMVGSKISPSTIAAARLIISEAGGTVSDYSGKPTHYLSNFIASNRALHETALSFFGRNNSLNL